MIRWSVLVGLILAIPSNSAGQSTLGARGYVTFGSSSVAASDSLKAVAGTSRDSGWGGGGSVTGLWRGIFVDVAVSEQQFDGQRLFVHAGTVYPLGIPLDITIRPIDLAAGWRQTRGRFSPYAGAGLSFVSYKERGDFAIAGDDVDEQKSGALILGGVDIQIWKFLFAGFDVRYRSVSGVLGQGGVSDIFAEDQIGGSAVTLRISVGR